MSLRSFREQALYEQERFRYADLDWIGRAWDQVAIAVAAAWGFSLAKRRAA